jgi:hypothetical protein
MHLVILLVQAILVVLIWNVVRARLHIASLADRKQKERGTTTLWVIGTKIADDEDYDDDEEDDDEDDNDDDDDDEDDEEDADEDDDEDDDDEDDDEEDEDDIGTRIASS